MKIRLTPKNQVLQKPQINRKLQGFKIFLISATMFIGLTSVNAQNLKVSISQQNISIKDVLQRIEKQTTYLFVYNPTEINLDKKVNVNMTDTSVKDVLANILKDQQLSFYQEGNNIVLQKTQQKEKNEVKKQIAGVVKDINGEGLIGASVSIKGSKSGTMTDIDGSYSMSVPEGSTIEVTYMGYVSQTATITNQNSYDFTLKENERELEAVVVTALGIKRSEKSLSYNVQQINSDDITGIKDANFINSLNGKVAGVNINTGSSGVGGGSKVVMRGTKSILQSSNAFYVIDGIPMLNVSKETGSEFDSTGSSDLLADMNPEDIESISVLTGAAAAALYGSSAANGAIVITTKKGLAGKTTVTVTQNTDFMRPFVKYDFQNKYGTSLDNRNMSWGSKLNKYNFMGYDPYDDYFKTGVVTTESVSLSTGNDKNQTYVSIGAVNSAGIIPNNSYDRYNFTFRNTSSMLNDKMKLSVGGSYIKQEDMNMTNQGVYSNPIVSAYLYPRGNDWANVKMYETYDTGRKISVQNWDMDAGEYTLQNPYWINYRNLRENKKDRYTFNLGLEYKVLDWLTLSGRAQIDNSDEKSTKKNYASTNIQLTENSNFGLYGEGRLENKQIYADAMARVSKRFDPFWTIDAFVGASIQDNRTNINEQFGPIPDGELGSGLGEPALMSNVFNLNQISPQKSKRNLQGRRQQTQSVYGSLEIGFKDAYYLSATLRTDWPSQLAGPKSTKSSFTYPSIGFSTVLSEIINLPKEISYLKVRGSYANVGNAFQEFLANPRYQWNGTSWDTTYPYYPLVDLKPERTNSYELGLTARFLNDFSLDVTYYNAYSKDQTIRTPISAGSGYDNIYVQSGNVQNSGFEVSLGYDKKWNNFAWSSNFTLSTNKNKVKKLARNVTNYVTGEQFSMTELDMGKLGDTRFYIKEGGTLGDIYSSADLVRDDKGRVYINENGEVQAVRDIKGVENWTKLGSVLPKANLAWKNDFNYKGISLGFLITARLGGVVFSRSQATFDYYGVSEASANARDRGGVMVDGTMVNAYNWYNVVASSDGIPQFYTYSATNVRLQEASIGYTFPRKWTRICDATVSLIGRNLLMIYKKAPYDPESVASTTDNFYQGVDYFMTPSTRNIGFSVRLKF